MGRPSDATVPLLDNPRSEINIDGDSTSDAPRTGLNSQSSFKFERHLGIGVEVFEERKDESRAKQDYCRRQKAMMEAYKEVDLLDSSEPLLLSHFVEPGEDFAVNVSNFVNVLLLILKVYASVRSKSISIIASTLDSLLDLLAGGILWFTKYSMRSFDKYKYPIGKARVQPVGIIVFAAVMATLGLQVLIEAAQRLVQHESFHKMSTSQLVWLCSIMGAATVVKLALYIYCRSFKSEIVQAYSQDHYFDVITNIAGLAGALLAQWSFWWIDPVGGIFLALYTIVNWSRTLLENAASLIGKGAPPEMLQKLTYLAFSHHNQIKRIDTVRAYTFGSFYFVEVDIELPEEMPLKQAHDIGETLQDKIERLPEVERAFVHLDYESQHKPEHSLHFRSCS